LRMLQCLSRIHGLCLECSEGGAKQGESLALEHEHFDLEAK
jgi:hypothetical protein